MPRIRHTLEASVMQQIIFIRYIFLLYISRTHRTNKWLNTYDKVFLNRFSKYNALRSKMICEFLLEVTLRPYILITIGSICLKFHSNSVHCLYWIALKREANRFIRSWDIYGLKVGDFLPQKQVHQSFWNGVSTMFRK